jgi:CelD/BcsL family acetyltransferase involved in cellulose biosynthesis
VVPHRFAIAWRGTTPCGAALVAHGRERYGGVGLRTLHLGTAAEPHGESIYVQRNALLAHPADRRDFAVGLVAGLARAGRFDELRLDGFVPEHAADIAAADPSLRPTSQRCSTVDLQAAAERGGEVLALLSANTRYQVRRSLRGYGDSLRTEYAETVRHALAILDDLVVLHEARWRAAGSPGAFARPRQLAFHRQLITRLLPTGRVVLFRVRNQEGTVGCLYSHVDQGAVLSYQLGLAPSPGDNKLKPGFVTHTLCMQACYERGLECYDFLSGGGGYKAELATGQRELIWARGLRHGPAVAIAEALHRARRLARPLRRTGRDRA